MINVHTSCTFMKPLILSNNPPPFQENSAIQIKLMDLESLLEYHNSFFNYLIIKTFQVMCCKLVIF